MKIKSVAGEAVQRVALPARSSILFRAMRDVYAAIMAVESKQPSRPRDANQLAKLIADIATGEQTDRLVTDDGRDLAAVLLGRRGGLKGGRARAESLSPEKRRSIARQAAEARWGKSK